MVNSLPAAAKAASGCPPVTATYRLSFAVRGFEPDTTVTANSCPTDQISVSGKVHPPLLDKTGTLAAAVTLTMPTHRYDKHFIKPVQTAARRLSGWV